jgi:hypothetical protein
MGRRAGRLRRGQDQQPGVQAARTDGLPGWRPLR